MISKEPWTNGISAEWAVNFNIISPDIELGDNFEIGRFCIIERNVVIGNDVRLRNFVELRYGTIIGNGCYIDSGVKSSGQNRIGNDVTIRYDAIIARGCDIGDGCYICPQVMFNNVDHHGEQIGGAKVGANCFIGTNATIGAGITLAPGTIVGAKAFLNQDTDGGVWVGCPARRIK
jgi:UDP-3-O-[3-hydroxymyristoyl] glucosamine N-acyltransferase